MGFSIFMASMMTISSFFFTLSPTLTLRRRIRPGIGATTFSLPVTTVCATGAAAGAGAAWAEGAAWTGAACWTATPPMVRIRSSAWIWSPWLTAMEVI